MGKPSGLGVPNLPPPNNLNTDLFIGEVRCLIYRKNENRFQKQNR